jgi:hypothetical protein
VSKKLKLKIPKRVAGIRIPKSVRKGPVADFIKSSAGQEVIAQALVVLGGTFAARRSDSAAGEFLRRPARAAEDHESDRLSAAFRDAVQAFRATMEQERPRDTADAEPESDSEMEERDMGSVERTEVSRARRSRASSQRAQGKNRSTPH